MIPLPNNAAELCLAGIGFLAIAIGIWGILFDPDIGLFRK
jgi:hypothetical protein